MWNDLSRPWQVCLGLSWESFCEGSIPIAAVITDPDGAILAQGRNRAGGQAAPARQEIIGGPLAHAEVNALLGLDYASVSPHDLTLYTTVEPCPLCIGAVCMAGLKTIRYAARDAWSGSTNLLEASPYLRWKRIEAIGPEGFGLETVVHLLQVEGQLRRGHPRAAEVLAAWEQVYPRDVRLGRLLYESGELQVLQEKKQSAEQVVSRLHAFMSEAGA